MADKTTTYSANYANLAEYAAEPVKVATNAQYATQYAYLANLNLPYAMTVGGVAGAVAETPGNPVYDKATATLGVLKHVDKVNDTFLQAMHGIRDLRETLDITPLGREKSLIKRIEAYLRTYLSDAERAELLGGFYPESPKVFRLPALAAIPRPGEDMEVEVPNADGVPVLTKIKRNEQSALYATGRVMVDEIRLQESLRHALTIIRRRRQSQLARRQDELAKLEAKIPETRKTLDNLEPQRQEALGDLAVAKRLLAEHWAAIEQAWAERRRILENHLGLYYVRVRETPLSLVLPDPLDLRPTDADDIVPGCSGEIRDIPAALSPFLEAVYDVPVGDWAGLRPLYPLLPERARIEVLVNQRREQLTRRQSPNSDGTALSARLLPLRQETLALARDLVRRPFSAAGALSLVQQQGRDLLSLDDLLAGPPSRLRPQASGLHQRLGNAAACLVQRLRGIPPSVRLDWAEAAENARLPVQEPERWPGLDKAEAADFNGVRTLVELVRWWFRQLDAEAAGGSRTALQNYIRAAILFAASDDPGQILRGHVATLPGRFKVGEILRLKLNREAAPGALLALMDPDQRVVGTLRVDDNDDQGAVAVVTQVLDAGAAISTAWQVSGKVR